jgi:hypothetical protein
MQFVAKPVLDNKFWILEDNGQKVGTIRSNENGVTLTVGTKNQTFKALSELKQKIKVDFTGKEVVKKETNEYEVHGYACKTKPHNPIYDLKRKLPLYTKTSDSQSFFCAGYYVIHWEDGNHSPAYCPKLITLSRYTYDGPFKTKLEMQEILRRTNG